MGILNRIFSKKKDKKQQGIPPARMNNYGAGYASKGNSSSNDMLDPLNPVSPFNPFRIWDSPDDNYSPKVDNNDSFKGYDGGSSGGAGSGGTWDSDSSGNNSSSDYGSSSYDSGSSSDSSSSSSSSD